MHDILIAGGGPAGAVAAAILARAGVRVVVFDRAVFPRDKLCGDSLNPGALGILRRLGLDGATAGALAVDGMIVTGDRVRVEGRYGGVQGRMVRRRDLDAALLRAASAAGAQVEEGALVDGPLVDATASAPRVTGLLVKTRGGGVHTVTARIVIAADGRHSRTARPLGLSRSPVSPRRWAVGAYFEGVEGLGPFGEMHVRRGHYIGVAPLPGGLANACVVTGRRAGLEDPAAMLLSTLRSDPMLAPRFSRASAVCRAVCLGPLAVEQGAGVEGLLLAGDAAGFVDPMTGDGLRFAFRGAELAAAEALRALEQGTSDAHVRLAGARRKAFAGKWLFNRSLRLLVSSPAAVRAAGAGAALAPSILRRVIRRAADVEAV